MILVRLLPPLTGLVALAACAGAPPPRAPSPPPSLAAPLPGPTGPDLATRLERIEALAEEAIRVGQPAPAALRGELERDLAGLRHLARIGERAAAIERAHALVRLVPGDPLPGLLLARLLLEAGQPDAALQALERLPAAAGVAELARPWRGLAWLFTGDLARAEPELREELARGREGALAARALAKALCALERHGDAEAVLGAALVRVPDEPELAFAMAELQRDLFRRDAADRALREITGRWPDFAAAALALAELCFERAQDEACAAALATLPRSALEPGSRARLAELEAARAALVEGRPRRIAARALLAALRGGDAAERRTALAVLLATVETREAAFCAACTHGEAPLRELAVRALPADEARLVEYLAALADDEALAVRRAVAERGAALADRSDSAWLLSRVLDAEEDPAAFRGVHDALCAKLGGLVELAPGAETDPRRRDQVREAWRMRCPERSW
ncbi:MAG: tetratricopeptide repeat protein [Planctomycetes bacterium]|nr:tetratricopeptide repeat protein [Planctomycetota bacterium]